MPNPSFKLLLLPVAAVVLAACSTTDPMVSSLELPPSLSTATASPFQGMGGGRSGSFILGERSFHFERSASVQSTGALWNPGVSYRATEAKVTAALAGSGPSSATCKARDLQLSDRIALRDILLTVAQEKALPWQVECTVSGAELGTLAMTQDIGTPGKRPERTGVYTFGAQAFTIRSSTGQSHTALSGLVLSPYSGYVISFQGQDIAALDLSASRPVLWKTAAAKGDTDAHLTMLSAALGSMLAFNANN